MFSKGLRLLDSAAQAAENAVDKAEKAAVSEMNKLAQPPAAAPAATEMGGVRVPASSAPLPLVATPVAVPVAQPAMTFAQPAMPVAQPAMPVAQPAQKKLPKSPFLGQK